MNIGDIRTNVEKQLDSKGAIVSDPFHSGEFVQEREWTCPDHSHPHDHVCDCDHCDREWDCEKCAVSSWVAVFNADGSPKMRELGWYDASINSFMLSHFQSHHNVLLTELTDARARVPLPQDEA